MSRPLVLKKVFVILKHVDVLLTQTTPRVYDLTMMRISK